MGIRDLKTEFITAGGTKAVPTALTLRYDSIDRLRAASWILNREIAVRQTGVFPETDQARKDFAGNYASFSVYDWGTPETRRAAFDEIVEMLGGDEEEIRGQRGWLDIDRKGFEIPVDMRTELKGCLAICEKHGLMALLNRGPGWHDFADGNPARFNRKDNSVTINFRKKYDDQAQGVVIRDFLSLLEKNRLLPDSMALAGAEDRLSRRLTVQFSNFARGLKILAEPAPLGMNLNSSFFIEETNPANRTVTLVAAPEIEADFRENRFAGLVKPLTVNILENKPV